MDGTFQVAVAAEISASTCKTRRTAQSSESEQLRPLELSMRNVRLHRFRWACEEDQAYTYDTTVTQLLFNNCIVTQRPLHLVNPSISALMYKVLDQLKVWAAPGHVFLDCFELLEVVLVVSNESTAEKLIQGEFLKRLCVDVGDFILFARPYANNKEDLVLRSYGDSFGTIGSFPPDDALRSSCRSLLVPELHYELFRPFDRGLQLTLRLVAPLPLRIQSRGKAGSPLSFQNSLRHTRGALQVHFRHNCRSPRSLYPDLTQNRQPHHQHENYPPQKSSVLQNTEELGNASHQTAREKHRHTHKHSPHPPKKNLI
mmetsp:Transcript_25163/g.99229  ORF Transcript_25163/g.99229 Transcript_25163/m.99229 type:complete len:314 (-) Transcript_25163:128-1069(-)